MKRVRLRDAGDPRLPAAVPLGPEGCGRFAANLRGSVMGGGPAAFSGEKTEKTLAK